MSGAGVRQYPVRVSARVALRLLSALAIFSFSFSPSPFFSLGHV